MNYQSCYIIVSTYSLFIYLGTLETVIMQEYSLENVKWYVT